MDWNMKVDKKEICRRIQLLVDLCENTEPADPTDSFLFSGHLIAAKEILGTALGRVESIGSDDHSDWAEIMRQANKLWTVRKKIEKEGWDFVDNLEMHETIEDLLSNNQKIAAIKYYREIMKTHFNTEVKLKESKDFVDDIEADMIARGVLVK
jgi:hypothetical protein